MPTGRYKRKLTAEQVQSMLEEIFGGMTHGEASLKYGISRAYVGQIVNGKACWDAERRDDMSEMTEEELEALIAEQMPTMPKEPRVDRTDRLPLAVSRGIGVRCMGRRVDI
jgi:hypothetical protein